MTKDTQKLIAKREAEMREHLATWDSTAVTTDTRKPRTDWHAVLVGVVIMITLCWAIYVVGSLVEVVMI